MPSPKRKRPVGPAPRAGVVVFSDVDGTLLDFHTYSAKSAEAALRELKRLNVPLVLVSSKTRAELEELRKGLGIDGPFIPENGGAIYWPKTSTPVKPKGASLVASYWVRELGTPYATVRKTLIAFRESNGVKCEGFGDWSYETIARLSGVPQPLAKLAKQREYDEPFLFDPVPQGDVLDRHLKKLATGDLRVARGGRFFHLSGPSDKGRAVQELIAWYVATAPVKPRTVAIGDSPTDWPMMATCDIGVAVKQPDGRYHPALRDHKGIRLAGAPGPEGFNRMILRLLKQLL